MDKEDVVHVHSGVVLSDQKGWRPLTATQMGLEIITLSEVSQKEKDKHAVTYMWYLTYDTDGHIYETEMGSHT